MKIRTLAIVIAALLIVPLVLFACGAPEPTPMATSTPAPLPTQAPTQAAPTAAPTATRRAHEGRATAPERQAAPTAAPAAKPARLLRKRPRPTHRACANSTSRRSKRRWPDFGADRAAKVEAVVKDADIAAVQAAMQAGKLTSDRAHPLLPVAHPEV